MRIAFHQVSPSDDARAFAPLSFGYLAAFLEHLDFEAKCTVEGSADALLAVSPDVIGLSCSSPDYGLAIELARELRQRCRAKIILGGDHVTNLPESFNAAFDVGVMGEGEDTFHHLMSVLRDTGDLSPEHLVHVPGIVYFNGRERVTTTPRDVLRLEDQLPPPIRDILPPAKIAHVMTGRGCPHGCRFCVSRNAWGPYRAFPAERSAAEIAELFDDGHGHIHLHDDLFLDDAERLVRLADLLEDDEILGAVEFSCAVRPDAITDERMELLVRLNVTSVSMGLESADDATQKRLGKGYDLARVEQAVDVLERFEIGCRISAIVGEPEETLESMLGTYTFLIEQLLAGRIDAADVNILSPLPGTDYWDQAVERGLVGPLDEFDWSRLRAPWRGLPLNDTLVREAARLVMWDRHLRGVAASLARPLLLVVPEDVDLDLDADPRLLRGIFLLSDEAGLEEVLAQGEVDLVRLGPDKLREQLTQAATQYGAGPLVMFVPDPSALTMDEIKSAKLTITMVGRPMVRGLTGGFPLTARLTDAVKLDDGAWAALAAGDPSAMPDAEPAVELGRFVGLPHTDLDQAVPSDIDGSDLLDHYTAELAKRRRR